MGLRISIFCPETPFAAPFALMAPLLIKAGHTALKVNYSYIFNTKYNQDIIFFSNLLLSSSALQGLPEVTNIQVAMITDSFVVCDQVQGVGLAWKILAIILSETSETYRRETRAFLACLTSS